MTATRRWRGMVLAVLVAGVTGAGCGTVPPLAGTHPTAQALMAEVLAALAARDRGRLEALAVSETEFRDHIWPRLPAARPERNLPMSYVWGDLHQKSAANLARILASRGGAPVTLLEVRFEDPPEDYTDFVVHGGVVARVRSAGGADDDWRVTGSLVEQDGRWKVFSYVVND